MATKMFPGSGVPAADAVNSLPDVNTVAGCDELWYSTSRCQPRFDPAAANAMLAEIMNLINKGEVSYDCSLLNNVEFAARYLIQRGLPRFAILAGGPNAFTGVMDPPITRYNNGMVVTIVPNSPNGGPMTLNLGLGIVPVLRNDIQQLVSGDLATGVPVEIAFQNGNWYVVSLVRSQVNQIVATIGTNTVVYNSGTGTFIVPPGVFILREIEITGAGGGGGGGGPAGGGGNGGCTVKGPLNVTPGQAIGYSVGAPGNAGTLAIDGTEGGTSAFGSWYAAGGKGGHTNLNPGNPWGPSSGGVEQYSGGQGDGAWAVSGTYMRGGTGGTSTTGGQGGNGSLNGGTPANAGIAPGGGGGGGSSGGSGVQTNGGAGSYGRILIRY